MAEPGHEILIKDAIVFLFAAGVAVPVFRYLKLPAVVGFMLSGIALGPYALGSLSHNYPILEFVSISEPEAAAPFAELGVLFLLFLLGLEFSFEKLWALRRAVFAPIIHLATDRLPHVGRVSTRQCAATEPLFRRVGSSAAHAFIRGDHRATVGAGCPLYEIAGHIYPGLHRSLKASFTPRPANAAANPWRNTRCTRADSITFALNACATSP